MTQVPFSFESERLHGNLAIKQLPNYHLSDLDKVGQTAQLTFPKQLNGNLATVLLPYCHSTVHTHTQTQKKNLRYFENTQEATSCAKITVSPTP